MLDDRFGGRNGGDRGGDRRGGSGGGSNSSFRGERRGGGDGGARNADVKPQVHLGFFKWLDFEKGYGFITPDEKGKGDMFAHISCLDSKLLAVLRDSFASGESLSIHQVRYQVAIPKSSAGSSSGRNTDKPFAVNVSLASDAGNSDGFEDKGDEDNDEDEDGDDN